MRTTRRNGGNEVSRLDFLTFSHPPHSAAGNVTRTLDTESLILFS